MNKTTTIDYLHSIMAKSKLNLIAASYDIKYEGVTNRFILICKYYKISDSYSTYAIYQESYDKLKQSDESWLLTEGNLINGIHNENLELNYKQLSTLLTVSELL